MILCSTCYLNRGYPRGHGRAWFPGKRHQDKWGNGLAQTTTCHDCGDSDLINLYTEVLKDDPLCEIGHTREEYQGMAGEPKKELTLDEKILLYRRRKPTT